MDIISSTGGLETGYQSLYISRSRNQHKIAGHLRQRRHKTVVHPLTFEGARYCYASASRREGVVVEETALAEGQGGRVGRRLGQVARRVT